MSIDLSKCCSTCPYYQPYTLPIRIGKCHRLIEMGHAKENNPVVRILAATSGLLVLEEFEKTCKWRPADV